jgi:hypothetical protein
MIYALIFTHWLADFVCQTDEMAKNKSKSNRWLVKHILAYMAVLSIFAIVAGFNIPSNFWMSFVLINGVAHFIIDYFTSRLSSACWAKGEVHNFFVVIGFDQALHMSTLYGTYQWLLT